MAGTRAPFASLAALAAVASVQAQEGSQKNGVEEAKRDLQSLPTVQRPVEGTHSRSLFPSGSLLPELAIVAPSPGKPEQRKEKDSSDKSGGWLVDGVKQLEADAQSKLTTSGRSGDPAGDRLRLTDERKSTTTHPFAGYLDQWLSPADKALLSSGQAGAISSSAPWETPRTEFAHANGRGDAPAGLTEQLELSGLDLFTQNQPRTNPYLGGETASEPRLTPLVTSSPSRETPNTLPPLDNPASPNLPSAAAPRVEEAQAASSTPPTSRLVDDRKYFPQLRRF